MKINIKEINEGKRISLNFSGKVIELPANIKEKIEDHWQKINNSNFFRGKLAIVENVREENGIIKINIGESDYAHYLASLHQIISEEFFCQSIFNSVMLKTSDGYFVFGEMAAHTSVPKQIQCAGGALSLEGVKTDNIFLDAKRELAEEMYLNVDDQKILSDFKPIFIKSGGLLRTYGIFFSVRVFLTKQKIKKIFLVGSEEEKINGRMPEFSKLIFVKDDNDSVNNFLENDKRPKIDYLEKVLRGCVK